MESFLRKKSQNSLIPASQMWIFSSILYGSKLNIFVLWTKQDIWIRHLGLWETVINMFHHFLTILDQTTSQLIEKISQKLKMKKANWQKASRDDPKTASKSLSVTLSFLFISKYPPLLYILTSIYGQSLGHLPVTCWCYMT